MLPFLKRYSRLDDHALVEMTADGDERAFREVLERHQPAVYGFARRMLCDAHEAADVAQDTFLRFYRSAERYRPETGLRAYLFRIVRNLCHDRLRRKTPQLMDDLPDVPTPDFPLRGAMDSESMAFLGRAVEALPESQRAAVILRHIEGMSYAEIAESMETSVPAVESLLVRARRTLRRSLEPML